MIRLRRIIRPFLEINNKYRQTIPTVLPLNKLRETNEYYPIRSPSHRIMYRDCTCAPGMVCKRDAYLNHLNSSQ